MMKNRFQLSRLKAGWLTLVMYSIAFGQDNHSDCAGDVGVIQSSYTISFGDTINTGVSSSEDLRIIWNVTPQKGVNKVSGTGTETGDLIFSQPGDYKINFLIPSHGSHRGKTETIDVKVSGVKMNVDISQVHFSRPLTVGDVSDITLTVPVEVNLNGISSFKYTMQDYETTGNSFVRVSLIDSATELKEGLNNLTFKLSGTITELGHIQFRVYDTNGEGIFFNKIAR